MRTRAHTRTRTRAHTRTCTRAHTHSGSAGNHRHGAHTRTHARVRTRAHARTRAHTHSGTPDLSVTTDACAVTSVANAQGRSCSAAARRAGHQPRVCAVPRRPPACALVLHSARAATSPRALTADVNLNQRAAACSTTRLPHYTLAHYYGKHLRLCPNIFKPKRSR